MLIRISERFRRDYGLRPVAREVPVRPFPQTWNVDVFDHGAQRFVLASEEHTLFSLLIPMKYNHIESFQKAFRSRVRQLLENVRWWQLPYMPFITFAKRQNRSVIGSQNDLLRLTVAHFEEIEFPPQSTDLLDIEQKVNSAPMSYLNMDSPAEALQKALRW